MAFSQNTVGPPFRIGLLMLEECNSLATHAFVDPFRCANYLRSSNLYEWLFLGQDSAQVAVSNGATLAGLTPVQELATELDMLVVSASWNVEKHRQPALLNWLRIQANKGVAMCGIDTGAFVLGYAGLLSRKRSSVHYEHIAAFRETFSDVDMGEDLFVIDGNRLACCGGVASVDLALEIIRLHHGAELANASGRYLFHERLRHGHEGQLPAQKEPVGYTAPQRLREAIVLMESNLEHLLSIGEIAQHIGLSQRQLERLFKGHTGVSPVRYYLDVRLDRARGLVTQTQMSIFDVAVACGFTTGARFSRAYRTRFGIAPSQDRIVGRVPFQFRSFPSHAGLSAP